MKQTVWAGSRTCDICGHVIENVLYDAQTEQGCWATLCEDCFSKHGVGLGTGSGQKYEQNKTTGDFEKVAG